MTVCMVVSGFRFEVSGDDHVIKSIVRAVNARETRMRTWNGVSIIQDGKFLGQNVSLTLFPDRVDIMWAEVS